MNTENGFVFVEDIAGYEFDWFAVDKYGHWALFSTGGSAMVPPDVARNIEDHSLIPVPATGNGRDPWKPLAKAGLTVFDMFADQSYVKKVDRECEPRLKLLAALNELPERLVFDGSFTETDKLSDLSRFKKYVAP